MTLGVRAVVLDAENRVFLVRHTYVSGWYLPGGGVDLGETMEEAMARELKEEGDIDLTGPATLHGIFLNRHVSRRDHIAVYVVSSSARCACPSLTRRSSSAASSRRPRCPRNHTRRAAADRRNPEQAGR